MRKLVCSACGRPATIGGLCEEHYTSRHGLLEIRPFEMKVCDSCGAVFDRVWKMVPLEDALRIAAERAAKKLGKVEQLDFDIKKVGGDYIVTVKAWGTVPPAAIPKTEIKQIKVRIRRVKCTSCTKLLGRYHEAVIQIRGKRAEQLAELAERVAAGKPKRAERLKYGWNLYFVRKADARATVREIEIELRRQKEKRLEVIRSYKLVGKKGGKELWRDFYAIR
ncbi:MAG: NMD3-related protein [Candidatus Aenigmatarchaeota archaeon]